MKNDPAHVAPVAPPPVALPQKEPCCASGQCSKSHAPAAPVVTPVVPPTAPPPKDPPPCSKSPPAAADSQKEPCCASGQCSKSHAPAAPVVAPVLLPRRQRRKEKSRAPAARQQLSRR